MKQKLKSYSFWMSVTASVILVLTNVGDVFGFAVQSEAVTKIVDSICGVLILFGVLTMSTPKESAKQENEQNKEEIDETQEQILQSDKEEPEDTIQNSDEPKNEN